MKLKGEYLSRSDYAEKGIVTEVEFEAKKKQLLGLYEIKSCEEDKNDVKNKVTPFVKTTNHQI